jgi:hypothetical protein
MGKGTSANKKFWEEIIAYFTSRTARKTKKNYGPTGRQQSNFISLITKFEGGITERQHGVFISIIN